MPLPANVKNKKQGDIIRSEDWNIVTNEVDRLDTAKSNLAGAVFTGPLAIRADSNNGVDGAHLRLIETQANDFARLSFHNNSVPAQAWHIAGLLSAVAGTPSRLNFWHNQKGDVLSLVNDGRVEMIGGNWDVNGSEGDLRIGNGTHRLKIGVALGGGGAGDVRIRAVGGTNRMMLGGGTNDTLTIGQDSVTIATNSRLFFGNQVRQMLNLWGTEYGIGVQSGTLYYRTGTNFAWHRGGVHSDGVVDPGTGGTKLMHLDSAGSLVISGGIYADNSDIYFRKTDHNHTAIGNAAGFAAIENAASHNCLMILGRQVGGVRRIQTWDHFQVNGTFVNNSDERGKKDIEQLPYGLDEIKKLKPVSFYWKHLPNIQKSIGLLAQSVREVMPDTVFENEGDPAVEDGKSLSISYISLIPVLINAIKELDEKLDNAYLTIKQLRTT